MGAPQASNLNTDSPGQIPTTGEWADPGDASGSRWIHYFRSADGGISTIGSKADTAVTAIDTTPGSVIALIKGVGSRLATIITSLATIITNTGSTVTQLTAGATTITKLEDNAHASGDAGVMSLAVRRDTAAASSGTSGDYEPLQTDSLGALRTVDAVAAKVGALTNATVSALAASLVVKASAGTLYGIQGYTTTAGFLLVHNTTTVPADTAVPAVSFPIEANKPFSLDLGVYGRAFATGITVVFSTTGPTKTIGGSVMWVDAQYL